MSVSDMPAGAPTLSRKLRAFSNRLTRALPRFQDFFTNAIGQVRVLKKIYPGIMHAFLFWGVTIQVLGTILNLMQMQLFIPFVELVFPRGAAYLGYEFVMDLAGIAILVGVFMAALRRIVLHPKSLETRWDDYYALVLLALLPLVGFFLEGSRLLAAAPAWAGWSPAGNLVASLLSSLGTSPETAALAHQYLFWTHLSLGIVFIASIPFTKLRHLVLTPLNVILRPRRAEGVLEKIDNIEEVELLGVGNILEFEPQQLLSFDACVRCGRCEEVCPAALSGMPYSPRVFIQTLRQEMVATLLSPNGKATGQLIGETLPEETPWFCTTCGACLRSCPAFVNPIDTVVDLRRYQVLTTGKMPKSVGETLRNMERQGNPWGMPAEDRVTWFDGSGVRQLAPGDQTDVLLFLGCAFAYDERNKKVAQALVRLLQKTGVDFGVLGIEEICCGETARRLGNEYLFQVLAQQNIETFSKMKFNRMVTPCPHCFNTLKNEYPQFGGEYTVQHYSEYLVKLDLPWSSIKPVGNGASDRLSYHDSCYLGRYNQIYQAPRQLLDRGGAHRVELPRRGENSFCCGGGGGQMWLESDADTRINHRRLEDALRVQVGAIATACPYCLLMFDDAIRSKGLVEKIKVYDIAEWLADQFEN